MCFAAGTTQRPRGTVTVDNVLVIPTTPFIGEYQIISQEQGSMDDTRAEGFS
jgi:hypothetical protein